LVVIIRLQAIQEMGPSRQACWSQACPLVIKPALGGTVKR
jgi:hypothetical protein